MDALRLGLKNGRHTEARVSGGFEHSRYLGATRGGDYNDDQLHFDRAENKVKAAAEDSKAVEARQTLARVYLARGTLEDAGRAMAVLDQLMNSGVETPEALNDIGMAHLQLEHYDKAISYFTDALAKSSGYNEALFNRALAEALARRDDDARRDWKQFINQSSDENWKAEAKQHLNRLSSTTDN
jgi:tetratricopeptide (TPR) repeat protein